MNSEEILTLLLSVFPEDTLSGIMLTGSRATKQHSSSSDYDIILVSRLLNRQTTEHLLIEGHNFHIIFFPENKIIDLIVDEMATCKYMFLYMFRNSEILLDKNGLLNALKKAAINHREWANDYSLLNLRNIITSDLEYMESAADNTPTVNCACEIYLSLNKMIQNRIIQNAKHLDKHTAGTNDKRLTTLKSAFYEYLNAGKRESFIAAIDNLLSLYGGRLNNYTTGFVHTLPSCDAPVMIYLPMFHIKDNEKNLKLLGDTMRGISSQKAIAFFIGNNQVMEKGTYIAVFPAKEKAASTMESCKKCQSLMEANGVSVSYPYQTSFFDLYTCAEYCTGLNKLLLSWIKKNGVSNLPLMSIFLAKSIIETAISSEGEQKEFIEKCICNYLPETADINGYFNIRQLKEKTEKTRAQWMQHASTIDAGTVSEYIEMTIPQNIRDEIVKATKLASEKSGKNKFEAANPYEGIARLLDLTLSMTHCKSHEKLGVICYLWYLFL